MFPSYSKLVKILLAVLMFILIAYIYLLYIANRALSNLTQASVKKISSTSSLPTKYVAHREETRDSYYLYKMLGGNRINLETEKFTLLMLTYKRTAILRKLLAHYCETGPRLDKILIIWNDIETPIPTDVRETLCSAKLDFIIPSANKLSNRYYPYDKIKTEGTITHVISTIICCGHIL